MPPRTPEQDQRKVSQLVHLPLIRQTVPVSAACAVILPEGSHPLRNTLHTAIQIKAHTTLRCLDHAAMYVPWLGCFDLVRIPLACAE
jgi:hypothetical protein